MAIDSGSDRLSMVISVPGSQPYRSALATRAGGRSSIGSYRDGRSWRAISIRSSKPLLVRSATRAPRRSRRALVATVVP